MNEHKYIIYSDKQRVGVNTEISFRIIEHYFGKTQTRKKWKKDNKTYNVNWIDGNEIKQSSKPINYLIIAKYIREKGYFDYQYFNLSPLECFWLDTSLDIAVNWHKFDHTAPNGLSVFDGFTKQQFGEKYPIEPIMSREGRSFTTLQPQLLNRIRKLRDRLINNSQVIVDDDWFFDLRSLISDTISLVEITLTQFYIKAEYDPLPNWTFDIEVLGKRHGRKFDDKINWIYKITGNHLKAEKFLPSFTKLRELRNHFMHFDPPSLIITIEEATIWINCVIDTGFLLITMRDAMGVSSSLALLNFVLQKDAVFNPEPHFAQRLPLGIGNADYKSSNWPRK
ncbi:hypothetical protein ERX46_05960 [Brumimicrobium glaciale]|uniref:Uncharacterized protein n=1 Tax=Brumimicrobium glaciale TaxID=200475 RepID=A0A4Q4KP59_9FLAO|nr:hypothetical protein [Brumimicrobium glaciale]RYM34918.1 hypothetical protein ERX46_05960 [Brumimicrobium glaciale]